MPFTGRHGLSPGCHAVALAAAHLPSRGPTLQPAGWEQSATQHVWTVELFKTAVCILSVSASHPPWSLVRFRECSVHVERRPGGPNRQTTNGFSELCLFSFFAFLSLCSCFFFFFCLRSSKAVAAHLFTKGKYSVFISFCVIATLHKCLTACVVPE